MRQILILSLGRLGDLIQTTPLLRQLKHTYPGAHLTIALHRRFAALAELVPDLDQVVCLDQDEVARTAFLDDNPAHAYALLDAFVRELGSRRYDLVINLASSRASAYLTTLVETRRIAGLSCAPDGQRRIHGGWSTYLFASLLGDNRQLARSNLVDTFTGMAGLKPDGRPVELAETPAGAAGAQRLVVERQLAGKTVIALQLGASDPARCWSPADFAALSDELQRDPGVTTILVGARSEAPLAAAFAAAAARPALNLLGATDLATLYSLLKRCSLLVTNDTGTLHFAAAAGTKTVLLATGPAHFWSTGPYGAGHLALAAALPCAPCRYGTDCHQPACRAALSQRAVFAACQWQLGSDDALADNFTGCRVYQSGFAPEGHLTWRPLFNADPNDPIAAAYDSMWRRCLDRRPALVRIALPEPWASLNSLLEAGLSAGQGLVQLAQARTTNQVRLAELAAAEAGAAQGIRLLGLRFPHLAPLTDYFALLRDDLPGTTLLEQARATASLYRQVQYCLNSLPAEELP